MADAGLRVHVRVERSAVPEYSIRAYGAVRFFFAAVRPGLLLCIKVLRTSIVSGK